MSDKTKWNWIAQDSNVAIYKYNSRPNEWSYIFMPQTDEVCEIIQRGIEDRTRDDWKESLINLETHDYKIIDGVLIKVDKAMVNNTNERFFVPLTEKHSHYKKDVRHLDYIDVYRIIELYELHDPCFQHALKKILVPGARGHKDLTKDINDIIDTMQRKLEMMAENEKKL